ncbi:hypothetical protein TNCV_5048461 [Trichonephila clavipes]|nr:hypothetical protein TNCV_5048461 [Trichonephila clavipes]
MPPDRHVTDQGLRSSSWLRARFYACRSIEHHTACSDFSYGAGGCILKNAQRKRLGVSNPYNRNEKLVDLWKEKES